MKTLMSPPRSIFGCYREGACVSVCGVGSARTGAVFGLTAAAALDVLCLSFVEDRLNNNNKENAKQKTSEQENTESAAGRTWSANGCGDLPILHPGTKLFRPGRNSSLCGLMLLIKGFFCYFYYFLIPVLCVKPVLSLFFFFYHSAQFFPQ